jgi:raffinose/stachyose/melibiose transport system permease protein
MGAPGIGWIAPGFILSVGLIYFCIVYSGYIATLDWDGMSPVRKSVGLDNFTNALTNKLFWGALKHTVIFYICTFLGQTILGFVFAALLQSKIKLAVVYKVLVFIPVVIAPAIMAPVHRIIFATDGTLNSFLRFIGLGHFAQPWLSQTSTALWVVILVQIWTSVGFGFILFFAAMGQIEPEILEAARIDGAGNIRVLWSVVLPDVRGTVVVLAILNAIGSLKLFDFPYLLTAAGPAYSTDFLGTYIYRETAVMGHVGYAAALSLLLLVLAVGMSIIMSLRGKERTAKRRPANA